MKAVIGWTFLLREAGAFKCGRWTFTGGHKFSERLIDFGRPPIAAAL